MNTAIVVAIISAFTGLAVVAATYSFNRRRDREAEWRRLKLEHYREFIAALSGVTGRRATDRDQVRYSDAVNSLMLVTPPDVLRALYAFQDEIGPRNLKKSQEGHDASLAILLRAVRRDIYPTSPDDASLAFRLFDAPKTASDSNAQSPSRGAV